MINAINRGKELRNLQSVLKIHFLLEKNMISILISKSKYFQVSFVEEFYSIFIVSINSGTAILDIPKL